MFDGTGYAVAEIVWWMVAAASLGVAVGWLLRRFASSRRQARELAHARDRIAELEARLAEQDEEDNRPARDDPATDD